MEWSDFSQMLEFPIAAEQLEKFASLEKLILRLNRKHNLVSANDLPLLRERHLQDGLTALFWMRDAKGRHLDLGSGTGFPLLPLAIAQPGRKFVGVESRSTRVMQMCYLAGELGLRNVELVESRIEELPAEFGPFETATSRALGTLEEDWFRAKPFLSSGGRFITFKSTQDVEGVSRETFLSEGAIVHRTDYQLHPQLKTYSLICLEKRV